MADASSSVQVVVRLRPMNEKELKGNTLPVVTASTEQKQVTVIRGAGTRQQRNMYGVDNVFTSFSTQKEVSKRCGKSEPGEGRDPDPQLCAPTLPA